MSDWNPRYLAYCRATGGLDPDVTLKRDSGRMTGFILWIGARWREWDAINGRAPQSPRTNADHAAFDRWLDGWTEQAALPLDGAP